LKQTNRIFLAAGLALAAGAQLHSSSAKPSPQAIKPSAQKIALASGQWKLDPWHSTIGFSVKHVTINEVHGTFDDFEGNIVADGRDVSKSSVDFTAKVASINTRVKQRDDHLRSPDFFDAEKYPTITFKSTKIEKLGNTDPNLFRATGLFTMHGVTKTISFPFQVSGPVVDGFGYTRGGIKANLVLNRQDYGVKWNQKLDNGGWAVDNLVKVNLDLEAIKDGTGPKGTPK
jgi:polyisoprenoid-binding protein YceI